MDVPPAEGPELDREKLLAAMIRRLPKGRLAAKGEVAFPAAPTLRDHCVDELAKLFSTIGRPFSAADLDQLRSILERKLREGFELSPYSTVVVSYETDELPSTAVRYRIGVRKSTMADQYNLWVNTRTPPLFGSHPDAKIMDLARSLGDAEKNPALDVGAGTGRNTLPLARAGHPTDAVEVSPDLAQILRDSMAEQKLEGRVFESDILGTSLELPTNHYRLILLCEVVSHFRKLEHVRLLFERAAELLAPGGLLVLSAFLAEDGYEPDPMARELSEVHWCSLYTRGEFEAASASLGLELVSDESVFEYEKAGLPPEAWPPTGWFSEWATGLDLFDMKPEEAPIDMRWLVYRKG